MAHTPKFLSTIKLGTIILPIIFSLGSYIGPQRVIAPSFVVIAPSTPRLVIPVEKNEQIYYLGQISSPNLLGESLHKCCGELNAPTPHHTTAETAIRTVHWLWPGARPGLSSSRSLCSTTWCSEAYIYYRAGQRLDRILLILER